MAGKYSFRLRSVDGPRDFPSKIIVGQQDGEPASDVLLKALAFNLFFRERLQIDVNLHSDAIPFRPGLVQLDYELRPKLWIECGDIPLLKLDKLSVKAPEAQIYVVLPSVSAAEALVQAMKKGELRRRRYTVIGLESQMTDELCSLMRSRNEIFWVSHSFEPPELQFEFNGLWFEGGFSILPY